MRELKLEKQSDSKRSPHALAGANLRKELKHRYPNTKFKVGTSSYSGGSSVRVQYEDGPKIDDVQAIVNKYVYGHFNGMEDIYEYDKDASDEYGEVKYGLVDREYSKAVLEEAIKEVGRGEVELLQSEYSGRWYITGDYNSDTRVYWYMQGRSYD